MRKKLKIVISSVIGVIIVAVITVLCCFSGILASYKDDTQENYVKRISNLKIYSNTLETAVAQTDVFKITSNHFNSALPDGKTVKKAIILGFDGCRADNLASRASDGAINSMIKDGAVIELSYCGAANFPDKNTQRSSTAPGWSSILTGKWGSETGITDNFIVKSTRYNSLLTTLVESNKASGSAFYTAWNGHFKVKNGTYNDEKAYCEENNLNVKFEYSKSDELTQEKLLADIGNKKCSDFIFGIYESTDHVGHFKGFLPTEPQYQNALTTADTYAKEIIDSIKSRETFDEEDWLVIITSDHGGYKINHGGSTIQERMTFLCYENI